MLYFKSTTSFKPIVLRWEKAEQTHVELSGVGVAALQRGKGKVGPELGYRMGKVGVGRQGR